MVLITGATGLLGRVIALELLKKGEKVRACKRPGSDLSDVRESFQFYTPDADVYFDQIDWIDIDLNNHQSLCKVLKDVHEVYHCAAKVSLDPEDDDEILETGIIGTRNLLNACLKMPVQKFLFVSVAETIAVNKSDMELQIRQYNGKNRMYPPYIVSKYIAERYVWDAYRKGLRTIIINPGMILGMGSRKKEHTDLLHLFFTSKFTFSGSTPCVDVRDVAAIAVRLMEKNLFGERFCISSENVSFKELSSTIRHMMRLPRPVVLPRMMLKAMGYLRPVLKIMDKKACFLSDENIEWVCTRHYYSGKKLKKVLSFSFYPVKVSLEFHCRNFRACESAQKGKSLTPGGTADH